MPFRLPGTQIVAVERVNHYYRKKPPSRAVGLAGGTALDTPDTNDIHHLRNLTAASTPRLALKPVQLTSPGHQQTKAGTECAANHIPT